VRAYTYPALHRSFKWRLVAFASFMLSSVMVSIRMRQVDVVIGTSPPIFQAFSAWLVSFFRRRLFVLEIRDLWPEFAIDMGVLKNSTLISMSRWLERFLYARAKHIIVNSPAYKDYLVDRGVSDGKISLIPNGVDKNMFDPTADGLAFQQEFSLDKSFVVTYAGALGLANDIPVILRAADRLREYSHIRFLLVGDGKERPALEKFVENNKLTNVIFTGSVPKSVIPEVLAASDVCVATLQDIPMFRTTYPNKVFDYMASGRPVILAIDGVIRQVVEASGGGVYVRPGDDKGLAEAVRFMDENRKLAQRLGKAGRDYIEKHFDRSKHAEDFFLLLHRLMGKTGCEDAK